MKENVRFYFNNALSTDMGLSNVNIDDSLFTERLFADREIKEEKIAGKTKSYFVGVEEKPLEFELAFVFNQYFDNDKLREVSKWLNVNYYREFYFLDNPNYRYFCMPSDEVNIIHNGLKQGYLELTMKCNDAYAYSQEYLSAEHDLVANTNLGTDITIVNDGDLPLGMEMWIRKVGDGDVTITNTTNGKIFEVVDLIDGEEVYIDNEDEEIESDIPNRYLFDNLKTDFMKLEEGQNVLNVKGTCRLQFRYRFKYITVL